MRRNPTVSFACHSYFHAGRLSVASKANTTLLTFDPLQFLTRKAKTQNTTQ
jgi:hypothetical protein